MNRRQFIGTGAALSATSLFSPRSLFAESAIRANQDRFPKRLEPTSTLGGVKEFHIWIDIIQHEIVPGVTVHMLAFNDQVPGPEIRVTEGDQVRVVFENRTQLNHTIHWHGLHVPWRHDGVPFVTQLPTMPNMDFVYEFEAKPYGTHIYHCHWGTLLHMQVGMYGSIIIEAKGEDPIHKQFPYDREYTLVYSSHDTNWIRREMNHMLERMKERTYLMQSGRFERERFGVFADVEDFERAVEQGYIPPYVTNVRSAAELPHPNFFTVNGKSYPMTPRLYIREGENIRVRLINAGGDAHSLHLHGYDFWLVADDGIPLAAPYQMNTLLLAPGKTHDIIIEGKNRGIWTFHDHDTRRVTNNGIYPGGTLTALVYEDLPEEERLVDSPLSGLRMQGMDAMEGVDDMKGMDDMEGMEHAGMDHEGMDKKPEGQMEMGGMKMNMDLDGLTKLPFISLDQ